MPLNSQPEEPVHHVEDAQSNPEPASPSLPEPDPGVFHHEPGKHSPQDQPHV